MAMMKVRLKDDAHVMNVDKMMAGIKSFIGRKPKRMANAICDYCGQPVADDKPKCDRWYGAIECMGHAKVEFAPTGEVEEVSDHADHMQAVRDGHLELVTVAEKKRAKE